MSVERNKYYYTGLFVTIAVLILILFLMFSGFFKSLKKSLYVESYFTGSVEGLSIGSPVKFHGVPVGKVVKIQFIDAAYPQLDNKWGDSKEFSYIYVLMAINSDDIPGPNKQKGFDDMIKSLVKRGLQTQISPAGLTGDSYIALGFHSSDNRQLVSVSWQPKYAYVPAAKSSLEYFSDSIKSISDTLKQVDFVRLADQISQSMIDLNKMSENINDLINDLKINPSMLIFTKPPKPIYQGEETDHEKR